MFDRTLFTLPKAGATMALLAVLSLVRVALVIGQAWGLTTVLVDLWHGEALVDQIIWIVCFLACFIARQIIAFIQDKILETYAQNRCEEMRSSLLQKLFEQGNSLVQKEGVASLTNTALEGVEQVQTYLRLILPKPVELVISTIVMLVFLFAFDWVCGLVCLIVLPFIGVFMSILGGYTRDVSNREYSIFQLLANHFIDSVRGLDALRFCGRNKEQGSRIYDASERFREATMRTLRVAQLNSAVMNLFLIFALAACAILLGFRLVDGSVELWPALFILMLIPEYFQPIRDFASDFHATLDGGNALSSIMQIIGDTDGKDAKTSSATAAPEDSSNEQERKIPLWDEDSSLRLQDVVFSYEATPTLQDLDIEISGLQKIGIIGMSGAGKSTLINLLAGFYSPTSGTIDIDSGEAEPLELDTLHRPDWQRQILEIPQNPYIFHASLRDNIRFYTPEADDDAIAEAAEVVGLGELIAGLDEGLDTVIGEGGRTLSGGQAQRIALARAFLDDNRRVLLFDEPTAHLDIETELELKERMLPLMEGRLVLFATHRLHWVDDMDLILVMDKGRIAEVGTPAELRRSSQVFKHLVSQMGGAL
ncbi:MAG: thiol reductant ABC exporter subunit CydD [Coriobacteriaceae bacterium]|nr:thiol reductant ABC exporter subunit CydD [Coriobacteriaceae bacterium]